MRKVLFLMILFFLFHWQSMFAQNNQKHRVIILTDIEADSEDTQSFVRLLLYSNKIDIKGLVATTSCLKRTSVAPESTRNVIKAYKEVQSNLIIHEPDFPKEKNF